MKRYTLGGYDAYMEEWPGGSWVSHEDAEQAERERDEARDRYELAMASLRAEVERLKVDASNHAADAEAVRRERDRLAEIGGGK